MKTEDSQTLVIGRLITLLSRVGEFWLNRSYFQQILIVLVLLLGKNVFDIELRNIQEAYLPGAQEFPRAVGYFSASFGQVIIAYGLGVTTTTQWVVLHAVLIALALGVALYLISKVDVERRSFMILVLASATATSALFVSIGKYDVITYLGAVILALARTLPGSTMGALIMASGNPEQAIVASVALLALSFAAEFRRLRYRAVVALVAAGVTWFGVQLWLRASEMYTDRTDLIATYLRESITNVVSAPGTALWSWLNVGWLFALIFVLAVTKSSRKWIAIALVTIPGMVTVITADGARVFGLVVLTAYLSVALWYSRQFIGNGKPTQIMMGVFAVSVAVLPVVLPSPGWFQGIVFGLVP